MSPFKYYLPWEKPGGESLALEQPDSIKVQYTAKVGNSSKPKDVTAYVVPDRGVCVESCLYWTLPQFQSNIVERLDEDDQEDDKFLLSLFAKCLQGNAKVMFLQAHDECVVDATSDDGSVDYTDLFKKTVQIFLEKVAGYKYIGDAAIRMLIGQGGHRKPLEMTPNTFFLRRQEIFGYATGGYLRVSVAIPTQKQLMEAAFMACPRAWQEKYAEVHEEVDADGKQLLSSFTAYHAADLRAGTLSKIRKDADDKKKKKSSSDRPAARQDQRRGGKRSGRDYHRDNRDGYRRERDDRGYDRDRRPDRENRDRDRARRDDRRDYDRKGHDRGYDKGRKPPYKKSAREEVHHTAEEHRADVSRSRSRSGSRVRSKSPAASSRSSRYSDEGAYHADRRSSSQGPANGVLEYSSDEDRRQDVHKSYKGEGGYRTFDAPGNTRKR